MLPTHRFYPTNILLPDFVPNDRSVTSIVSEFALLWSAVLGLTWLALCRWARGTTSGDKVTVLWFVLCKHARRTSSIRIAS